METPILDERKWAKVPSIPADCYIVDLEDSVVPARKLEARERVLEYLKDPAYFHHRPVIARPNNLATPWGRDDIIALASVGATLLAYPKVKSAAEIDTVAALVRDSGGSAALFPIIESAGGLLAVAAIAARQDVAGLFTGLGDLSVDAGIAFRGLDGEISPALASARSAIVFACAAFGRSATDALLVRDMRDKAEVLAAIDTARRGGFTSLVTFYPPHIELINEMLPPRPDELNEAAELVHRYEVAMAEGRPAVLLDDGRSILAFDYQRAKNLIAHSVAIAE
jgi:citrate lyase beta subunit